MKKNPINIFFISLLGFLLFSNSAWATESQNVEPSQKEKQLQLAIEKSFSMGTKNSEKFKIFVTSNNNYHILSSEDIQIKCTLCKEKVLLSEARKLGAMVLARKMGASPSVITILGVTEGEELYIDNLWSISGEDIMIEAGRHTIELYRDNVAGISTVKTTLGQTSTVSLSDFKFPHMYSLQRNIGIIASGTGLAFLSSGLALIFIDGKCIYGENSNCTYFQDTKAAGITAVSIGGAFITAGATLLIHRAIKLSQIRKQFNGKTP